ncbi:NAD(P)-dependent oxidoreductase [bacterium]|jgi:nucleoside-diphosphate-sugar epimerase|nr:NAD(P)-dependent oxidoreductase [bacterium]
MKIAITGSNGFLAQYFCKFTGLNKRDVFFLTTSPPVKGQLLCQSLYSDIDVILNKKNIDTIIHFASVIPVLFSDSDYDLFSKNNKMMRNLYNFSIKSHLKKFIYSSGFGSMNNPKLLDIKDYYTMSKITGEYFCSMMEANNIETASLRISAPYGEFSSARTVLNIFTEKAMKNENIEIFGSGKREQNFTYAGDIVRAIELALKNKVSGVYSIVAKSNTNMENLANTIIRLTNSSSKIITGKNNDLQEGYSPNYDYEKAKQEFGYSPVYTLERGLERYIKWLNK